MSRAECKRTLSLLALFARQQHSTAEFEEKLELLITNAELSGCPRLAVAAQALLDRWRAEIDGEAEHVSTLTG